MVNIRKIEKISTKKASIQNKVFILDITNEPKKFLIIKILVLIILNYN